MLLTMEMCSDSLMLYSLLLFKGRVQFSGSLTPSPPSNPPPPLCRLWSIRRRLPVPHVIFFLWHGSPLPTAWYSGVGMHAPSQIHQLRSECRTTARGNGGMRRERERREKRGGREREGRSVACRHPSGTKASNWQGENEEERESETERERQRERQREGGGGGGGGKGKKKKSPLFEGATMVNYHLV